jgi:hypothetical protein
MLVLVLFSIVVFVVFRLCLGSVRRSRSSEHDYTRLPTYDVEEFVRSYEDTKHVDSKDEDDNDYVHVNSDDDG